MKRILVLFFTTIIFIASFGMSVSASPTDSYTHSSVADGSYSPTLSRGMYEVVGEITASSLGLEEALVEMSDICVGTDGSVYILCAEDSRLIKLNNDYTFCSEIIISDENGNALSFEGAQGIFVDDSKNLYISDTSNSQIIIADNSGRVIEIMGRPESSLIPKDFNYQPVDVAIDNDGYKYILSLGCYYGALVYSPKGEFIGFYGSNSVNGSPLDAISLIWDKLTSTDAKKAVSTKKLPYSFVDFAIDSEGYMVVCNVSEKESVGGNGQIRKIGPTGADILYQRQSDGKTTSSASVNFLEGNGFTRNGSFKKQALVSVDVDNDGFIYALDDVFGLIYVYDSECRLLNVFGGGYGSGEQSGAFKNPVALVVNNTDILVIDKEKKNITVFGITEYGTILKKADNMYISGDYEQAKPLWEEVLSLDRSNQAAYRGLAMNSYLEKDYKTALVYAEAGLDYSVYDLAQKEILTSFIADNFLVIILTVLIAISAIVFLVIKLKKYDFAIFKSPKVSTLIGSSIHPFTAFSDVKYKKTGSVFAAGCIMVLLYVVVTLNKIASGFLFTNVSYKNYNTLYTLAQTVGLMLLWSVSNWLVCSMFSGKGRFSEVFIATSYSMVPFLVFMILRVVLSHFLPLSGVGFMNGLQTAVIIYTAFLLFVAISTVHEYDFFKFASTTIGTVIFMLLIVFILFLFTTLLYQVFGFIGDLYNEIIFR